MTEPTPFERLVAQRADPDELIRYRCEDRDRPFAFHNWDPSRSSEFLQWYLGPELSRTPEKLRQIVLCDSDYVGTMHCILDIRPGEPVPGLGEGHCELGTILSSDEYYDYGCDLAALHAAGFELAWEAAQWLHAVGREQLAERHWRDEVYGDLTPRKIRLNLFHHPTPQDPAGYTRNLDKEDLLPPAFVFESYSHDADAATDLADFARAIALLTTHPDPTIDRLLRDPESGDVLRDLLLQRGGPVEMLLGDVAEIRLPWLPLPDGGTIAGEPADEDELDGELAELWRQVLRLDPMIDSSDPAIDDLPGPWIENVHGPRDTLDG